MKNILLQLTVCTAALLPLSQAQAKTFGDFNAGQKFKLKVTDVISSKTVGSKVTQVPVPQGIPKFKKGQTVAFTIGSHGELKGPGFSIEFLSDNTTSNNYQNVASASKPLPEGGTVYKDFNKKPDGANLSFQKFSVSGFNVTTNSVTYTFNL